MDTLHTRCAGLDVHKDTIVACVRRVDQRNRPASEVRTFGTTTPELLGLLDWLVAEGVPVVAMESTGVYWKPVFNVLEGSLEVMLVNPEHIKQVPGRKTDVRDCQWIAQLLACGLLKASFVPSRPIRELRDLTRQRSKLVGERVGVVNRVQKVLEDANVKLGSGTGPANHVGENVWDGPCRNGFGRRIALDQQARRMLRGECSARDGGRDGRVWRSIQQPSVG